MPNIAFFRVSKSKKSKNKLFLLLFFVLVSVLVVYSNVFFASYINYFNFQDVKVEYLKMLINNSMPIVKMKTDQKREADFKTYITNYLNLKSILLSQYPALKVYENNNQESQSKVDSETHEEQVEQSSTPILNKNVKTIKYGDIIIRNHTRYDIDVAKILAEPLGIKLNKKEKQVIIFHTHTSEAYKGSNQTDYFRSENPRYNVTQVGEVLVQQLYKHGINSIHDRKVNDYPSYAGSYKRSLKAVLEDVQRYPSAKIVLDIHRDAMGDDFFRVAKNIDGQDAARIMFVVGTNDMGLYHPRWEENLKLALKLQQKSNELYPGLCREIDLRQERFNQHVTSDAVIIEVGGNGNTLGEAERSMKYLADVVAKSLSH
jgi:stage II sporulation protein P